MCGFDKHLSLFARRLKYIILQENNVRFFLLLDTNIQISNFADFSNKKGMIFHENCLPADDSHEISYIFEKNSKDVTLQSRVKIL